MMRHGASMLELVIAIVVMGIAVSALPLILTQSQNSNAMALQQEAILATKAKMSYILAYEWDANSFDTAAGMSRVLDTTASASADNAFDANNTTRRIGHINADKRRRLWDVGNGNRTPLAETAGFNDIDDFHGRDENVSVTTSEDDYIFNINLNPTVQYISDSPVAGFAYTNETLRFDFNASNTSGNPTNIKMITINTTDTAGNNGVNVVLRAFASNIGESAILKKAW